jgi:hypothetical protein
MMSTDDWAALNILSQLYKSNIIYNLANLGETQTHNFYRVHAYINISKFIHID